MNIRLFLSLPPECAREARERWRDLNGSETAIVTKNDAVQLTFSVDDRESAEGQALMQLTIDMRPSTDKKLRLRHVANYDTDDIEQASLLFLSIGDSAGKLDRKTLKPTGVCPSCRLRLPVQSRPNGVRLSLGKREGDVDMFRAGRLWFARQRVIDEWAHLRGIVTRPASVTGSSDTFYEFTAESSLGYPAHGTLWEEPCSKCGRRRGNVPEAVPLIAGYYSYPQAAWDGSDFVTSATYPNGLFVSQAAWQIIRDSRWSVPSPGVSVIPVQLQADAKPLY